MKSYNIRITRITGGISLLSPLGFAASPALLAPACDPQTGLSSKDSQDDVESRSAAAYGDQGAYNNARITHKYGSTQYTLAAYYHTFNCGVGSATYLRQNLPLY